MNRDELLTKLAMDLPEWPIDVDHAVSILPDYVGIRFPCREITHPSIRPFAEYQIGEQQWLQRRADLINEPDYADAPEWARWKAQDADGEWFWYRHEPDLDINSGQWGPLVGSENTRFAAEGLIPAGHDWKTTLREVKRETRCQLNPHTSSITDSQAREFAEEFKTCSDGQPCGQDDYCTDCPNAPHAQDARRLDDQLARDIKQPRYQDAKGEDWIDEFARTATTEEFHGAMRFTIGKYNRRMGKKDDMLKEVRKMKDYCARWEQYILAKHR